MSKSFQDIILTLQHFWADYGCVVLQPYDMEVGAGTFHPATTLRALGPDHWNAAYVQPSRRPSDGRYGENPNRLGHYYQFQVILKPSPDNIQQLYLDSLVALGIDPLRHDIRFVEDDWESPTLGAWGLGWEVWCDGMEVTQFTYFQQVGGIECKPVSGELTYGLERLAMYIQGVENVYDLGWNFVPDKFSLPKGSDGLDRPLSRALGSDSDSRSAGARCATAPLRTAGASPLIARSADLAEVTNDSHEPAERSTQSTDSEASGDLSGKNSTGDNIKPISYANVFHRNEVEQSAYALEHADTAMLLQHFEDAEKECVQLLIKSLPLPAYDYCIKASHLFNLLDARGVIGVTERAAYIARVRALAKGCCEAYVAGLKEQKEAA